MKLYRIIGINTRTGARIDMGLNAPMTHDHACTILGKLTRYPWRRLMLEQL